MDQTKDNNTTNIPQSEETAKAQPQSQSHEASQTQTQTSYAVRPNRRQHRRLEYADKSNMLVANVLLIIGVGLKIAEVCIRLFKK